MVQIYKLVDQQLVSLNTDIQSLNGKIEQDQLQLTRENPLVDSIMIKIDLIGSFFRSIYRILENVEA